MTFEPIPAEHILESDWAEPEWAIEGWWTNGSFGVIGGAPKSFKSTLGLEMMVSLSTGVKFLGLFNVPNYMSTGHGLIIQEENSLPNLRRQLSHIATARGLGKLKEEHEGVYRFQQQRGTNLNLSFLNLKGFSLVDDEHLRWLGEWVTKHSVQYLLLDPLYMMLGGSDENVGVQLRPVLRALSLLKEHTGCAGILVHHTGKAMDRKGGRALLGHTYLHGWYEAAMFPDATQDFIRVAHELREMPPQDDHYITLDRNTGAWNTFTIEHDAEGRRHPGMTARLLKQDQYKQMALEDPHLTDEEAAIRIGVGIKTIERYRKTLRDAGEWPAGDEG